MKLQLFHLSGGNEEPVFVPYPHTLAQAMFPDITFAIVRVDDDGDIEPDQLVGNLPEGFQLDFATGAKKSGSFILTSTGEVAKTFWDSAEGAVGYGSNLLTPCWAVPPSQMSLTVLVVEDGELGTGDCHARSSADLWDKLSGDITRAAQFRLGVKDDGVLAKGTMIVDTETATLLDRRGVDLVLPLSSVKSSGMEIGTYTWDAVLGIASWSEIRPTKFSWQVLQWFSKETIDKDIMPAVVDEAQRLAAAAVDTASLVELLRLEGKEGEKIPLLDVLLADKDSLLSYHPYMVYKAGQLLRKRWLDLALSGGQRFTGLMALPNDDLPLGVVCSNDIPAGGHIAVRFPPRAWCDIQVWRSVPGKHIHKGVVYMSHETASLLAGDFDGDYFNFASVEKYPAMANEIRSWESRPKIEILKVKKRRASPITQLELARVMLANADNTVGIVANLIGRANVTGYDGLIPKLAQQLQIAVDKFKFNLDNDHEFIEAAGGSIPHVTWMRCRKHENVYLRYPLPVREGEGTVGYLINAVNTFWVSPSDERRPLLEYRRLFPEADPELLKEAKRLNIRYRQLLKKHKGDKNERSKVFKSLEEWAGGVADPGAWACALWHAIHTKTSEGTGSLVFNAFPAEIASALSSLVEPHSEKVAIVGLRRNQYKDELAQFDGSSFQVEFTLRRLGVNMRTAATVDDKLLGFVSSETPVRRGVYDVTLTRKGEVVYAIR